MDKICWSEKELAQRWGIAQKTLPTEPAWLTSRQLASVTGIPLYLLANPGMRAKLKIPHSRIGSLIRSNTKEVIV